MGKIPVLTNIFQMGWNHQLDKHGHQWPWTPNGWQKTPSDDLCEGLCLGLHKVFSLGILLPAIFRWLLSLGSLGDLWVWKFLTHICHSVNVDGSEILRSLLGMQQKSFKKTWDKLYQAQLMMIAGFLKHQQYHVEWFNWYKLCSNQGDGIFNWPRSSGVDRGWLAIWKSKGQQLSYLKGTIGCTPNSVPMVLIGLI